MACPDWDVPRGLQTCFAGVLCPLARGLLAPQGAPVLIRKVVVWHSCSLVQACGGHSNILCWDVIHRQSSCTAGAACLVLLFLQGQGDGVCQLRSSFYRAPTFIRLSHFFMLFPSPSSHFCFLPASLHPFFFFLPPRLLRLRESSCSLCANTVFSTHACAPSLPRVAQR